MNSQKTSRFIYEIRSVLLLEIAVGKVTSAEAKQVRVGNYLRSRHLSVKGMGSHIDGDQHECQEIGIYVTRRESRQFLWWKWHSNQEYHVADLWIKNPLMGAKGKNWIMHVYGRVFFAEFLEIGEAIVTEFDVDVHVRLESEEPRNTTASFWDFFYLD